MHPSTSRSRRNRAAIAAAAVLAVAGLAGCGASGGSDGKGADTTTSAAADTSTTVDAPTTTTAETSTTEAATSTTSGGATTTTEDNSGDPGKEGTETGDLDTLPDGTHYGYFGGLEDGTVEGQDVQVLLFDKVEFLTGDAAEKAAAAHGDTVEDDYYIVNDNQKLRRLAVVPDGQVTTLADGGGTEQVPSSVTDVSKQQYLFKILVQNVRGITTITSIEAVYLP